MTCRFIYQFMIKTPRKKHAFTCVLTDEEKRERARQSAKTHYYNNQETIQAKQALYSESVKKTTTCFCFFLNLISL